MQTPESVKVRRYAHTDRESWDSFIRTSRNGMFLFMRDYLEYHSNRFTDSSLLFFDGTGKLIGLLPANIDGSTLCSHSGLPYGGVVSDYGMTTPLMLTVFTAMLGYLRNEGIQKLVYKAIPYIYHRVPSEEDLYALTLNHARLIRRDVGSTIALRQAHRLAATRMRQRAIKRAAKAKLEINMSTAFEDFMTLLSYILSSRHNAKPVHSQEEILYLKSKFPERIKLYTANKDGEMLAGALVYEDDTVVRVQYNANSDRGMVIGAADAIYDYLLRDVYNEKEYFDFGTSMAEDGKSLNHGLISYKESYGARSVVRDHYELDIDSHS